LDKHSNQHTMVLLRDLSGAVHPQSRMTTCYITASALLTLLRITILSSLRIGMKTYRSYWVVVVCPQAAPRVKLFVR